MRIAIITTAICSAAIASFAQDEIEPQYLFDMKSVKISGFGNTNTEFSSIDGDFGVMTGASGAFLFNYKYFLGFYGMDLATDHYRESIYPDSHTPSNPLPVKYSDLQLAFEHSGFWFGYIHNPYKLVHWGANMKVGWGRIGLYDKDFRFDDQDRLFVDHVFCISPEIDLEVNVTRWFKMNLGVGYRYVTGFEDDLYTNVDGIKREFYKRTQFNSPYANVKLLFGGFAKRNKQKTIQN